MGSGYFYACGGIRGGGIGLGSALLPEQVLPGKAGVRAATAAFPAAPAGLWRSVGGIKTAKSIIS